MTEKELRKVVISAKKNDETAFTELINYFKYDFFRIAKCRLLNDEDSMDVIQETILAIYMNLKKLKNPSKFKSWAVKILINNCNKMYSKEQPFEDLQQFENIVSQEDAKEDMEYIFEKLDIESRTLITLFYVENYTSKEISKILEINENTVRTKLLRIRNKLKNILDKEDFEWTN